MPLNATETLLRERRDRALINFQGAVTSSDRYLTGPGGYAGDGYPMPAPGKILRLYVYDGTNVQTTDVESSFNAGDRLSLLAHYDQPYFAVWAQINGSNSNTVCSLVLPGTTLRASLLIRLDVY
jgi:hypothetical protein